VIPLLNGWDRVVRADAVILRAQPRPVGQLNYRELYGPLRPMREIVEDRLAKQPMPMSSIVKIHDPFRFQTFEGEHCATVRIEYEASEALVQRRSVADPAALPKRPMLRMMGVTFADYFTTLLDGVSLMPEHFDEFGRVVTYLTESTVLMLGTRRRRYFYKRPPGWQALATPFTSRYIPPDYPNNLAMITMYAALPGAGISHWFLETIVSDMRGRGAAVKTISEPETVSYAGLEGNRWVIESERDNARRHIAVVLRDKDYIYRARLDHGPSNQEGRRAFDAMLASLEPIKMRTQSTQNVKELFGDLF
jgi:hypothetical protein